MISADDGRRWLADMPTAVTAQRQVLTALLAHIEADEAYRWLELSCSLARGAGDALSDIDAGVGVADARLPGYLPNAEAMAGGLGTVVDRSRQYLPGFGDDAAHLFTLYADGTQLSLVVMAASQRPGLPPGAVALYDPDGRLAEPYHPSIEHAGTETMSEWAYLGWLGLADLAKYLDRGSLWEARAKLTETREQIWRLWAAARDVTYPVFGLTSVLDDPAAGLPDGIDATVPATADARGLRAAARHAAEVLGAVGQRLPESVTLPTGLATFARERLGAP